MQEKFSIDISKIFNYFDLPPWIVCNEDIVTRSYFLFRHYCMSRAILCILSYGHVYNDEIMHLCCISTKLISCIMYFLDVYYMGCYNWYQSMLILDLALKHHK